MTRWILCALFAAASCCLAADNALKIYFIDVEGGQSTLFVTPSGQSLLVDTGWPGARDSNRIAAMAKRAGVSRIDYLLITHFHIDHVGGVPDLVKLIPVGEFIDHGTSVEHGAAEDALFNDYVKARGGAKHMVAKPGDRIPLNDVQVQVLTAAGEEITEPLKGGGQKNALCGSEPQRPVDTSENARSIGLLIAFGKFRVLDLGDLTWNKEMELVCPVNRVGPVDAYIVSHHGMNMSGSRTLVHALGARAAIMDNGARKGGTAEAYQAIRDSPGLPDIWQLHYAVKGGDANNTTAKMIANVDENPDAGNGIELTARRDGSFSVTNLGSGYSKTYPAAR